MPPINYVYLYYRKSKLTSSATHNNRAIWVVGVSKGDADSFRNTVLADDSEGNSIVAEREQLLRDAVDKLLPQRRQIVELAKLNSLSYTDIARQLHISRGTVSDHIVKANRFVRAYLQTHATLQVRWFLFVGK